MQKLDGCCVLHNIGSVIQIHHFVWQNKPYSKVNYVWHNGDSFVLDISDFVIQKNTFVRDLGQGMNPMPLHTQDD